MSNILVMHQNYLSATSLLTQTKSSELVAAPATNIYDKTRRTKVWRSAGHFLITSANKGIVMQEVAGVNQTVNIAEAAYTTDATFLAALKAALDSASGSAVYTVTRDTTSLKIKITSDGAGGAIFRLMCTSASFTSADVLGFSTGADRTGALTYTADSLRNHTSEWLRWDFGTSVDPYAFAMIGTRKDGLKISSTATVYLYANDTDVWTSPALTIGPITWDEDCMSYISTDGTDGLGHRYWKLEIVDRDNPNGYIEISNAYLGDVIQQTIGAVQFPLDINYDDYSRSNRGEWGTTFSDVRQKTRIFDLSWAFLTIAEKEALDDVIETYGTSYPFWVALDPNGVFSSTNVFVCLVRFDVAPRIALTLPGQYIETWSLREEV